VLDHVDWLFAQLEGNMQSLTVDWLAGLSKKYSIDVKNVEFCELLLLFFNFFL